MSRHRILRVVSYPERTVRLVEMGHFESAPFTDDELRALDAGRHVLRPDATIIDLNAYYEVSEVERGIRAMALVS